MPSICRSRNCRRARFVAGLCEAGRFGRGRRPRLQRLDLTMPFRDVLFDFDGTLADSFGAIAASTNHVRESYGMPPLPEAAVRRAVGYGINHLLRELV